MTRPPTNEYVWQGTGEADLWVARVEVLLAPLRYDPLKVPPALLVVRPDALAQRD